MGHTGGTTAKCATTTSACRRPTCSAIAGRASSSPRSGSARAGSSTACAGSGQAQRAFELMCERANSRFAHGSLLAEKGEIQRYDRRIGGRDPGGPPDDARRGPGHGRRERARVEISLIKFYGAHDAAQRDRPRDPGARRAGRHGRYAARAHVPRGARTPASTTGPTRCTAWSWPAVSSRTTRPARPGPDLVAADRGATG